MSEKIPKVKLYPGGFMIQDEEEKRAMLMNGYGKNIAGAYQCGTRVRKKSMDTQGHDMHPLGSEGTIVGAFDLQVMIDDAGRQKIKIDVPPPHNDAQYMYLVIFDMDRARFAPQEPICLTIDRKLELI